MEDLVPRAAYDVDETGYWERMPIVAGIMMAVGGTVITYATVARECPFRESVIRGMAGGFVFAVLFPALFRWMAGTYTSRAYAGRGRFATSPPTGLGFEYRLLCSAILGEARAAVGGSLYIGRSGLAFVPFSGAQLTFPMERLKVAPVAAPRSWLVRLLVPRPAPLLEAVAGTTRARFVLPTPTGTIKRIRDVLKM